MLKGIHASHGVRVKSIDIEFNFQFACQIYIVIHHACQWSKATYLLSAAVTRLRSPLYGATTEFDYVSYEATPSYSSDPNDVFMAGSKAKLWKHIERLRPRISERFYYFATIISHFSTLYMTEESFIYFVSKGEIITFA